MSCPVPAANRFVIVDEAVTMMLSTAPETPEAKEMCYAEFETTKFWSTHEWLRYIRGLEAGGATVGHYALADENYGFSGSPNPELVAAWFSAILKTDHEGSDRAVYKKTVEETLGAVARSHACQPTLRCCCRGLRWLGRR